jgi:FtsZ-binding cell division protein ZapB
MEILKQLETKVQVLVQQRNQLREELARRGSVEGEVQDLRRRLEDLQAERDALLKERGEVRAEVESILSKLEEMA